MVQLVPMNEEAFEIFMKLSKQVFIQDQILAGEWQAEDADKNMEMLFGQILPGGFATPNHYFFAIEDVGVGVKVGALWFTIEEEDGKRQVFVMDIQIYDQYRRQGYGSQAFVAMEEKVRELGITTIALHVFKHNHQARAMYEKLGYSGINTMMLKEIGPE